jgi:hypothetical protein
MEGQTCGKAAANTPRSTTSPTGTIHQRVDLRQADPALLWSRHAHDRESVTVGCRWMLKRHVPVAAGRDQSTAHQLMQVKGLVLVKLPVPTGG